MITAIQKQAEQAREEQVSLEVPATTALNLRTILIGMVGICIACGSAVHSGLISQEMILESVPTSQNGAYEVHVTLHRLSGEVRSWYRMNRRFLNILRKRFLLWRTISPAAKERYTTRLA